MDDEAVTEDLRSLNDKASKYYGKVANLVLDKLTFFQCDRVCQRNYWPSLVSDGFYSAKSRFTEVEWTASKEMPWRLMMMGLRGFATRARQRACLCALRLPTRLFGCVLHPLACLGPADML